MRYQEIAEGRDAPLYHATYLNRAINTLAKNKLGALTHASQAYSQPLAKVDDHHWLYDNGYIDAPTSDKLDRLRQQEGRYASDYNSEYRRALAGLVKKVRPKSLQAVKGVSLTRSRHFAHLWAQRDWPSEARAVFVLDQAKMMADGHKIVPEQHEVSSRFGGDQAEEFHIGPIENLDRYLLAIEVSEWSLAELKDDLERGLLEPGDSIDDVKPQHARAFLKHPKLKVVPGGAPTSWHRTPLAKRPNAPKFLEL